MFYSSLVSPIHSTTFLISMTTVSAMSAVSGMSVVSSLSVVFAVSALAVSTPAVSSSIIIYVTSALSNSNFSNNIFWI